MEWLDFVEWERDFVWGGLCVMVVCYLPCSNIDNPVSSELWEADQRATLDAFE